MGRRAEDAPLPRLLAEEGFNYRFNSVSFNGQEGWIVGKPAILLHTKNGGESWERIPLSAKLPGTPVRIVAGSGEGQAEMVTDAGAIYTTDNTAYTWRAAVEETVDATLNRTVSSGISGASYYEGSFSGVTRGPDVSRRGRGRWRGYTCRCVGACTHGRLPLCALACRARTSGSPPAGTST